jgi:DNA-binding SARP family transcriptional activator/uncharacterized membrane protein YtjA (UPF0391 family)
MTVGGLSSAEVSGLAAWISSSQSMGIDDLQAGPRRLHLRSKMGPRPLVEGLGRRRSRSQLLDALLVPRDARGIVLACGFVAVAALGVSAVVLGDPIGYGYLAGAAVGYFFLQTRLVPTVLWLLVSFGGVAGATAGNDSEWVVFGLGLLLAVVSLLPPAEPGGHEGSRKLEPPTTNDEFAARLDAAPAADSSRNLELRRSRPVAIRTMGRLRVQVNGLDVSARLHEQPRLALLFSYLLARTIRGSHAPADRSTLAEEVAPGIPARNQRDRLRKQLYALQTALGSELKGLLVVSPTHVSMDLSGIDLDVYALEKMSGRIGGRHALIDADLASHIRRLLEDTAGGEFLSGFSELEHQVTGGESAAEVVQEARSTIAGWRADLVRALAEYQDAAGQPQASIAYLRSALDQAPDRQDLARLLVAAYVQTGQTARASEIRSEYELDQEK